LAGYDYGQAGAYFITVCVQGRKCLFGEIVDGEMRLNDQGKIIQEEWLRTGIVRPNVELDVFIIMPNHLHGIINLLNVGATRRVAPTAMRRPRGPMAGSLGAILGQFKSITTKRIKKHGYNYSSQIWQRNYYEHVIRNEDELEKIREYIVYNPSKWATDPENPETAQSRRDHRDEMEIILRS